jgi:hypothetical protein
MEQSPPWGVNNHASSQEIVRIVWNPKVHNYADKKPDIVPILSHKNSAHALSPYFYNIRFNIILPSTPSCPKWHPPFMVSDWKFVCVSHFYYACCMPRASHLPSFNTQIIFGWEYKLWTYLWIYFRFLLLPPIAKYCPHYHALKLPSSVVFP